jgi:hypothetical protein
MFAGADLLVISKADRLPYVDFDVERCIAGARRARPELPAFVLSESLARQFAAAGLTPLRHRVVTPGDGRPAVGQAAVAAALLATPGESRGVSLSTRDA